jgi:oligoribonuclease NrnB/cAMP/cGMP phosphodiesterase (DHH superfamily)
VSQSLREDVYLFTDQDLDGAGCYYILRKAIGKNFKHTLTSEKNFRTAFLSLENKDHYKKIYICDLSVLESNLDILDNSNIVYINHRNTAKYNNLLYKNLRQESQDSPSCTLLLYKKLKDKLPEFTKEEKILITLINDYDSYELKLSDSIKLHYYYCTIEGDKLEKFYNAFETGFKEFTDIQKNKIQNIEDKIESTFNSLKIFKGDIKIGQKLITMCSTFNNIFPSEICDRIIRKYNADIALSVNLNTSHVSLRKSKNCPINLGSLAKKIFDGGGDDCVAGGKITKPFLELTKLLYPVT